MWDEQDYFSRWVQGIIGSILLPIAAALEYYSWWHPLGAYRYGAAGGGFGMCYLGYRCLRYAVTGRNNINRDDF